MQNYKKIQIFLNICIIISTIVLIVIFNRWLEKQLYPVIDINAQCVEGSFYYKNKYYVPSYCFYGCENAKKRIATDNQGYPIYVYGDKNNPIFIEVSGFGNSLQFIEYGKEVPTSGEITGIYIQRYIGNKNIIKSEDEIKTLKNLTFMKEKEEFFTIEPYETHCKFYYLYNNSAVTCYENLGGLIVVRDDKVIYINEENWHEAETIDANYYKVKGIKIKDKEIAKKLKIIWKRIGLT